MGEGNPRGGIPHDESPNKSGDEPRDTRRLTVREAAAELDITEAAVRNRISRGTLRVERDSGAVYVLLEADEPPVNRDESSDKPGDESPRYTDQSELVAVLREQLAAERRANEENRRIIAGLVQRIPELEAPPQSAQEAQDMAESASEGESGEEDSEAHTEPQERRPWWRSLKRIFGNPRSRGG